MTTPQLSPTDESLAKQLVGGRYMCLEDGDAHKIENYDVKDQTFLLYTSKRLFTVPLPEAPRLLRQFILPGGSSATRSTQAAQPQTRVVYQPHLYTPTKMKALVDTLDTSGLDSGKAHRPSKNKPLKAKTMKEKKAVVTVAAATVNNITLSPDLDVEDLGVRPEAEPNPLMEWAEPSDRGEALETSMTITQPNRAASAPEKQPDVPEVKSLSGVAELKDILLDNIRKVKQDKGYIGQATAVNDAVKTLIDLARTEIRAIELSSRLLK